MAKESLNLKINKSRVNKNDEFYTSLADIENELRHYWSQLEGKKIWCNCDDENWSNFYKFFNAQKYFHNFEVKFTSYQPEVSGGGHYRLKILEKPFIKRDSKGEIIILNEVFVNEEGYCKGDFRAKEQQELWKWADVIITNPPFSLFREFIDMIMKHNKKFLIIGGQNNISYANMFKYIKENKIWLGVNYHLTSFEKISNNKIEKLDAKKPNGSIARACTWFTNLDNEVRNRPITLCDWDSKKFVKYDNYEAYETVWLYGQKGGTRAQYPFTKNILGAPLTFLQKYCPKQFKILDMSSPTINGAITYKRLFIQMTDEYYKELKDSYI